jgi:hypothetical protein
MNMNAILFRSSSQVMIMTPKVDPHTEGGSRILITESFTKVKDAWQGLEKAQLIITKT